MRFGWAPILILVALVAASPACRGGGDDSGDDGGDGDGNGDAGGTALIVGHLCTDLARVPARWVDEARRSLRIGYTHTSHGSQLLAGMEALAADSPAWAFEKSDWGEAPGVFLNDYWAADLAADLGSGGDTSWRDATRQLLQAGSDRNVVVWSWCGGVSESDEGDIRRYLEAMAGLEHDFPGVHFVYMTGHLDGSGTGGNLHRRNEQIRAWCREGGKALFDFADIESYDPDGGEFLSRGADDGCNWPGGNWAEAWTSAHSGHELARQAGRICDDCCAHSHPLNCVQKGRAFWWMLARLAGWDGN